MVGVRCCFMVPPRQWFCSIPFRDNDRFSCRKRGERIFLNVLQNYANRYSPCWGVAESVASLFMIICDITTCECTVQVVIYSIRYCILVARGISMGKIFLDEEGSKYQQVKTNIKKWILAGQIDRGENSPRKILSPNCLALVGIRCVRQWANLQMRVGCIVSKGGGRSSRNLSLRRPKALFQND